MNSEAQRLARTFGDTAFHILVHPHEDVAFYCIQDMVDAHHDPTRPHRCPRVELGGFPGYEVYTVEEVLATQPGQQIYPAEIYELYRDRNVILRSVDDAIWHLMWNPNNPSENTYCVFSWSDTDGNNGVLEHTLTDPHYCPFIEADRRRMANGLYYRGEENWATWLVVTPAELDNLQAPIRSTHSSWITS